MLVSLLMFWVDVVWKMLPAASCIIIIIIFSLKHRYISLWKEGVVTLVPKAPISGHTGCFSLTGVWPLLPCPHIFISLCLNARPIVGARTCQDMTSRVPARFCRRKQIHICLVILWGFDVHTIGPLSWYQMQSSRVGKGWFRVIVKRRLEDFDTTESQSENWASTLEQKITRNGVSREGF